MAGIGLTADKGGGHCVAQLAALQIGVEDEQKCIGRPETCRAGHGADDQRSRIIQKLLTVGAGVLCIVYHANRLRVTLRPSAGHVFERKLGAGRNHQKVAIELAVVLQFKRIARGIDAGDGLLHKSDVVLFQVGPDREGDCAAPGPGHKSTQGLDGMN